MGDLLVWKCTELPKQKSICPTHTVHFLKVFIALYDEWDNNLFRVVVRLYL